MNISRAHGLRGIRGLCGMGALLERNSNHNKHFDMDSKARSQRQDVNLRLP